MCLLSLKLDGKIYVNLVSSLCFWLTEHKFTMGALFIILFMNRVYPHLEELNKTHKELRLRIKITKQDPSDDRSYLSALSYLLAPELADFCNCPDSRCFRLMNTKDNAITVRITPRTWNPSKLNLPPIMIPINNEERMVPRYLDVLNNPEATPIISFGELWNKAACRPTLFNPLLIPNAAKATHTLITGEVWFKVTSHTDPNVIRTPDTSNAGRGPDLSIQRPAIGAVISEHNPSVSMRIPVWNSLTWRTICK